MVEVGNQACQISRFRPEITGFLHCRLSGFDVQFTGEIENKTADIFFLQIEYLIVYSNQISIDRKASHHHRCQIDKLVKTTP